MSSLFHQLTSFPALLIAFQNARRGKRYQEKFCLFTYHLERNLLALQHRLRSDRYTPSPYTLFLVHEPKTRKVAAPAIVDRILQHALFAAIEPLFEPQFIYDSYACREGKGTHFGMRRLKKFLLAAHRTTPHPTPPYFLQCDIASFFQSIDWQILLKILARTIDCPQTYALLEKIVTTHQIAGAPPPLYEPDSLFAFANSSTHESLSTVSTIERRGLPIGNLTSQLFANIYLNELDHFIKDRLRLRWYGRYMDDFVIIHHDKAYLHQVREQIRHFLASKLKLALHPRKLTIGQTTAGIAFVGYRIFHSHVLIRGNTLLRLERHRRRRFRQWQAGQISTPQLYQSITSQMGHLKHANAHHLRTALDIHPAFDVA